LLEIIWGRGNKEDNPRSRWLH